MRYSQILPIFSAVLIMIFASCRKIIGVSPQVGTIPSSQVFSTTSEAVSAVDGIYYHLINVSELGFGNGATTLFTAMSSDELAPFDQTSADYYVQFLDNQLTNQNPINTNNLWAYAYAAIYSANATIEGLTDYNGVNDSVKNELIGECEFIRAFCNFYLTNLYGDIPLVTTINWHKSGSLSRTSSTEVYQLIVSDLTDAQSRLAADYSVGQGQRIVPNKWAATALLARVYLYQGNWPGAETQSTAVINSPLFTMVSDLNSVFLANSSEAIWQLEQLDIGTSRNATPEGYQIIPFDSTRPPFAFLTEQLLNSFEPLDSRFADWVDSTSYNGTMYYFPYKYKIGPAQAVSGQPDVEYYTMLRLAEQFLIRAEARAQAGESNSVADLNVIRIRAGLAPYNGPTDKASLLNAIYHERQIELFSEWGHRWLDLKRWGNAEAILSSTKNKPVTSNSLLYPIPLQELQTDPNLTQNPGY